MAAGRLVHVVLPAQDDERATAFWSDLFGWEWNTAEVPGLKYQMTRVGGDPAAAVYRSEGGVRGPIVYFNTDDIEAHVARVRDLGGHADDKQPIPGVGWFARCEDTEGNPFSLFQGDESAAAEG
jgi:predicted enzyme related to lactoylglutathione lyase